MENEQPVAAIVSSMIVSTEWMTYRWRAFCRLRGRYCAIVVIAHNRGANRKTCQPAVLRKINQWTIKKRPQVSVPGSPRLWLCQKSGHRGSVLLVDGHHMSIKKSIVDSSILLAHVLESYHEALGRSKGGCYRTWQPDDKCGRPMPGKKFTVYVYCSMRTLFVPKQLQDRNRASLESARWCTAMRAIRCYRTDIWSSGTSVGIDKTSNNERGSPAVWGW